MSVSYTNLIQKDEPKVYLTFDEGYENGYTAAIMDVFQEKQVSAVFFVTMPYVKEDPDLIPRMLEEGHVVGNHTAVSYTHLVVYKRQD